jgi:hypothetical protein
MAYLKCPVAPIQISDLILQHVMSDPDGASCDVTLNLLRARFALLEAAYDGEEVITYVTDTEAEHMFLERVQEEFDKEVPDSDPEARPWWPESMPLHAQWPPALINRLATAIARKALHERRLWQDVFTVGAMEEALRLLHGIDSFTLP